mmetsp:Transcript_12700/g.36301  ORF Transcript_12700/g.36301 Transcript_12700/m.36301 type:complete len:107 (+) Transcript_12700:289-609(+)
MMKAVNDLRDWQPRRRALLPKLRPLLQLHLPRCSGATKITSLHELPAPVALFMPTSISALRKGDDKTEREKWVECFEEKVVCHYLDEVFSPIRRWEIGASTVAIPL